MFIPLEFVVKTNFTFLTSNVTFLVIFQCFIWCKNFTTLSAITTILFFIIVITVTIKFILVIFPPDNIVFYTSQMFGKFVFRFKDILTLFTGKFLYLFMVWLFMNVQFFFCQKCFVTLFTFFKLICLCIFFIRNIFFFF